MKGFVTLWCLLRVTFHLAFIKGYVTLWQWKGYVVNVTFDVYQRVCRIVMFIKGFFWITRTYHNIDNIYIYEWFYGYVDLIHNVALIMVLSHFAHIIIFKMLVNFGLQAHIKMFKMLVNLGLQAHTKFNHGWLKLNMTHQIQPWSRTVKLKSNMVDQSQPCFAFDIWLSSRVLSQCDVH